MPRKNARPAAAKRRKKLAANLAQGRKPRAYGAGREIPSRDHGFSMGLAMAALGAQAISGLSRRDEDL